MARKGLEKRGSGKDRKDGQGGGERGGERVGGAWYKCIIATITFRSRARPSTTHMRKKWMETGEKGWIEAVYSCVPLVLPSKPSRTCTL